MAALPPLADLVACQPDNILLWPVFPVQTAIAHCFNQDRYRQGAQLQPGWQGAPLSVNPGMGVSLL
jgi:hypothetical protein